MAAGLLLPASYAQQVRPRASRGWVVPTNQLVTPAGRLLTFLGRPTDVLLLDDGRTCAVKNLEGVVFVDLDEMAVDQEVATGEWSQGVVGLAADEQGTVYSSGTGGRIWVNRRQPDGCYALDAPLQLPPVAVGGDPAATGLAYDRSSGSLLALSGRGNTLVRMRAATGEVVGAPIAVGVAPFAVVLAGSGKAYVSNWGGSPPAPSDPQAYTSDTAVKIDPTTGASAEGSVSVVDLDRGAVTAAITTGRHPSGLALSPDRRFLYVACANSDEVDVIATAHDRLVERIVVRPEVALPFGSGPSAVAVSLDGSRLYVANGTNNAIAVIELGPASSSSPTVAGPSRLAELIPTGWHPGALALRPISPLATPSPGATEELIVASLKGIGSRARFDNGAFNTHGHVGTLSAVLLPHTPDVAHAHTARVAANNSLELARLGLEPPRPGIAPRALPERHGEPSRFSHVIYIIKENRTYDQVLGDLPQGNGDPSLTIYGRDVTPNQHALAEEFVLLDNFHCSGVLSADGHAWATEAYATDYLERHLAAFVRSYPYDGSDPLAYSPRGFIWDAALARGLTFRSYGEFGRGEIDPPTSTWTDVWDDFRAGSERITFRATANIGTLEGSVAPTYVGLLGAVPDVVRAREFFEEFRAFESNGRLPNLTIILLPNDHTEGTRPSFPTPRAMVADNDLALGQIVATVTRSSFWPRTAIFVVEDDPQDGFDHVDAHRTVAQVISPYTRRGLVDSTYSTQVSMLKTIELILGLAPLNQLDLAAPAMRSCFREVADLTPYRVRANRIPLDEMNPELSALSGEALHWARASMELPLDEIDKADEDTLNRILWHAARGDGIPYPERLGPAEPGGPDDRERPR
ncbi:MAG: beta-propeller fold lactonase family protein [Acidobacteria bacterium]|nr:beta-propeller fold lactonase family protein [Acidobacteriota bacterium]